MEPRKKVSLSARGVSCFILVFLAILNPKSFFPPGSSSWSPHFRFSSSLAIADIVVVIVVVVVIGAVIILFQRRYRIFRHHHCRHFHRDYTVSLVAIVIINVIESLALIISRPRPVAAAAIRRLA